jgi:rfaE bifunctional protein kinase chain/domain
MTAKEILEEIPKLSVLVVGDICLDLWCRYDPALAEPSRETGLPRTAVTSVESTPGAGGTVANNLRALGVERVAVLGAIGEDGFGWELSRALERRGVSTDMLVRAPEFQTFTYTKLLNRRTGAEDVGRIDFVNCRPMPRAVEEQVRNSLQIFAPAFDVVMVSDQAETKEGGVVTAGLRESLAALSASNRIVWVDSRRRSELFRRVMLKPNRTEAEEASVRALGRVDLPGLREHTEAPLLYITDGANGATVYSGDGAVQVAGRRVERPVDICGAGDSFSAGAVLALAITGSPESAARFGNLVSSITIMKKGTGTASPAEVIAADAAWNE